MAHRAVIRETVSAGAENGDGDARRAGRLRRRALYRPSRSATATDDAAGTVLQLAVLLQAGVSPARAWEHLARSGEATAGQVVSSLDAGMPLPESIASIGGRAWREVGVAWKVAAVVGAPLAECLRSVAAALRDAQEAADDVRVALAEPAGTARLMGWLPLVAVALGAALGFDTLGTLFTDPFGIACLVGGGVLIVAAQRWTSRLVRRARSDGAIPGLDAELIAIALSGGVSIDRARAVVADARTLADAPDAPGDANRVDRRAAKRRATVGGVSSSTLGGDSSSAGATENRPDDGRGEASSDGAEVDAVLRLSRTAGVPAVELLRASAAHARHRARIDGRLRAARLSSRLLIPLGVCTLPAFLLLGVAPMLLSVISTMSVSL